MANLPQSNMLPGMNVVLVLGLSCTFWPPENWWNSLKKETGSPGPDWTEQERSYYLVQYQNWTRYKEFRTNRKRGWHERSSRNIWSKSLLPVSIRPSQREMPVCFSLFLRGVTLREFAHLRPSLSSKPPPSLNDAPSDMLGVRAGMEVCQPLRGNRDCKPPDRLGGTNQSDGADSPQTDLGDPAAFGFWGKSPTQWAQGYFFLLKKLDISNNVHQNLSTSMKVSMLSSHTSVSGFTRLAFAITYVVGGLDSSTLFGTVLVSTQPYLFICLDYVPCSTRRVSSHRRPNCLSLLVLDRHLPSKTPVPDVHGQQHGNRGRLCGGLLHLEGPWYQECSLHTVHIHAPCRIRYQHEWNFGWVGWARHRILIKQYIFHHVK